MTVVRAPVLAPQDLHPALWRASQLGRSADAALPSGHAVLDAELPGGGWPRRTLTELLLPHPGIGEMRLLAPLLARLSGEGRSVMLFDPPADPNGWALAELGLDLRQVVVVRPRAKVRGRARELLPAADVLWALEQALKSGPVGAVLGWVPLRVRVDALRRLQLAAQAHDGPAFLLRDSLLANRPSPASLRLVLQAAGADALAIHLIKRRGPALTRALIVELPGVLPAGLRDEVHRQEIQRQDAGPRLQAHLHGPGRAEGQPRLAAGAENANAAAEMHPDASWRALAALAPPASLP